jgi:hypothetical protein
MKGRAANVPTSISPQGCTPNVAHHNTREEAKSLLRRRQADSTRYTCNTVSHEFFPALSPDESDRMIAFLFTLTSLLSFCDRSRASLELELVASRHSAASTTMRSPTNLFTADWLL